MMLLDWCGFDFIGFYLILLGFFVHLWVLFGSDFGDIVGLVWVQFCWVLLVICGFFYFIIFFVFVFFFFGGGG